jgi:hypothetical protein
VKRIGIGSGTDDDPKWGEVATGYCPVSDHRTKRIPLARRAIPFIISTGDFERVEDSSAFRYSEPDSNPIRSALFAVVDIETAPTVHEERGSFERDPIDEYPKGAMKFSVQGKESNPVQEVVPNGNSPIRQ